MEILHSLVRIIIRVIKQYAVYSLLVTARAAGIPFVNYIAWVVSGFSWQEANYTLTGLNILVAGKFVEYYRRCVLLLETDGVAIVIVDKYSCGRSACDKPAIIKTICPAGKHSGAHCGNEQNKNINRL